ncbi:MAG: hypothetical protein KBE09_04935 [Candidatus Pacebacteria bacterium]|nr:hypothetical protein [Candidatus Paceibacterota bacterium]
MGQEALGWSIALMFTLVPVAIIAHGLQPLSPLITLALVVAGTAYSVRKGTVNAALALVGILLFPLSWVAHAYAGTALGMTVWAMSVLSWSAGLYRAANG